MTDLSQSGRFNTVIIGAGQSGLAVGYHLAQRGVDFVIVDAGSRIGETWRSRWDSLRLFTPASYDNLPGMSFPAPAAWHFPTKDETGDYLEAYAEKFSLPVELGVKVDGLTRDGDTFVITAGPRRFEADNVVVATGPFQQPRLPTFAEELSPSIRQLHSSAYRNPAQLPVGDTLVVGAATSGCEIAMDLVKSRRVYLSGRDVPSIPPLARRTILPWVARRQRHTFLGKRIYAKAKSGAGHPLIGFSYKKVLKTGVERVPRTVAIRDGNPQLEDGRTLSVTSVVWCTGWKIDFGWIDLPVFEADGYPRHHRGVVEEQPGLYFVGLMFLHSLSSQLLLGVARDSAFVAEQLVSRGRATSPAPAVEAGYQRSPA